MTRKFITGAGAAFVVPVALFQHTFSASPLPKPDPYNCLCRQPRLQRSCLYSVVVTGVNYRVAAFGYRGGSLFERRGFAMAGTFVKHSRGNLLIDTGFSRDIDERFPTLPLSLRAVTFYSLRQPAVDQLTAAGYDPKSLRAILLTHSHWDADRDFPAESLPSKVFSKPEIVRLVAHYRRLSQAKKQVHAPPKSCANDA
jgi:glyoxylase-like metal-dependent hydrolase (beta-lactamase superfamily II)